MSWLPKSSRMPAVVHLHGLLFVYAYYCCPHRTVYVYYHCLLLYLVCCLNWLGSIALYQLPRINCRVLIVSYQLTWIDCLDCLPHIACLVLSIASLYRLPHNDCLDSLPCIDCLVIALLWLTSIASCVVVPVLTGHGIVYQSICKKQSSPFLLFCIFSLSDSNKNFRGEKPVWRSRRLQPPSLYENDQSSPKTALEIQVKW
jgi:hypothetical protein